MCEPSDKSRLSEVSPVVVEVDWKNPKLLLLVNWMSFVIPAIISGRGLRS